LPLKKSCAEKLSSKPILSLTISSVLPTYDDRKSAIASLRYFHDEIRYTQAKMKVVDKRFSIIL